MAYGSIKVDAIESSTGKITESHDLASKLEAIALSNNISASETAKLAVQSYTGIKYFYDESTEKTYFSSDAITDEITDVSEPVDGVITLTGVGGVYPIKAYDKTTESQEELINGNIFPKKGVLADGMTVPSGTTHLRVLVGSEPTITKPIKKDNSGDSPSGVVGSINVSTPPYDCVVGSENFWLSVSHVLDDDRLSGNSLGADNTGITDTKDVFDAIFGTKYTLESGRGNFRTSSPIQIDLCNFSMSAFSWFKPDANTTAIELVRNDTRERQRIIRDLAVEGDNTSTTLSTTTGIYDLGSLNTECYNITSKNNKYGMVLERTQEWNGVGGLLQNNYLGLHLRSVLVDGGMTASAFHSYRFQSNSVGMLIQQVEQYPLGNLTFNQTLFQNSRHCALAIVNSFSSTKGIQNVTFNGAHFEANTDSTANPPININGASIPSVPVYIKNVRSVHFKNTSFGENDSPAIKVENSNVTLEDVTGYGNSTGLFVDADADSNIFQRGVCDLLGEFRNLKSYGIPQNIDRCFIQGVAVINNDRTVSNTCSSANAMEIDVSSNTTIESIIVSDPSNGWQARRTTFDTVVGSTGLNRIVVPVHGETPISGEPEYISLLMRAETAADVTIYYAGGGVISSPYQVTLGEEYVRVVITTISNGSSAGALYIYPNDTSGSIIYTTAMTVLYGDDKRGDISKCYQLGAFNPKLGNIN